MSCIKGVKCPNNIAHYQRTSNHNKTTCQKPAGKNIAHYQRTSNHNARNAPPAPRSRRSASASQGRRPAGNTEKIRWKCCFSRNQPLVTEKIVTRLSEICMFIFIADFTNCCSVFLCVYSIVFRFFQVERFTRGSKFSLIFYSMFACICYYSMLY